MSNMNIVLGIDIGGTNTSFGFVDRTGNIVAELSMETKSNDANAAAIGEMLFGNARGMKNFMVITLGTGLGSGIVIDGRLLYGSRGFGHTEVDPAGRPCRCGKKEAWRHTLQPLAL